MEKNSFITAVDLGCSKVVAAIGTLNPTGKVDVTDIELRAMQGIVRGEVTNIEQVTAALKEAVTALEERNGIKIAEIYASISGAHIVSADNSGFVYVGSDGEIKDEDVRKLCENMNNIQPPEGRSILTTIPQSYRIDSQEVNGSPVGMFGRQLEATFTYILGTKSIIERQQKAFDRVALSRKQLFPSALASATAVTSDVERELGVAVIDLGAGTTDLCIWNDHVARYAAVIPIGSDAINKDIRATAIPEKYIEELKIKYGYATASAIPADLLNTSVRIPGRTGREKAKDIPFRDISTIVEARLLDIIENVIDEIKASGYHNRLGAGIVLTGGGSLIAGIDTLFKERTGYDVRLGAAETNLTDEAKERLADPRLATAAGLLLMGIGVDSTIRPTEAKRPAQKVEKPAEEPRKAAPQRVQTDTDDDDVAPQQEEVNPAKETKPEKNDKKRGGLKDWFSKSFDKVFGVVDDDEI